jgi:hypothetical protein
MPGSTPLLFKYIEELQGRSPWGNVLDAGTGPSSARWLSGLKTESWAAVTASRDMARQTEYAVAQHMREQDRILIGNWLDPGLLADERFDTVLLDYVIGAMDAYAPYFQERALQRLRPLVQQRLYIVGVDPYVPLPTDEPAGRLIREIGSLRDACLLLAGERPYREFPMEWMVDQLQRAGFQVISSRRFANVYREHFVHAQLDLCLSMIERMPEDALRRGLHTRVEDLRDRSLRYARANNGLKYGADYVVGAVPEKNG